MGGGTGEGEEGGFVCGRFGLRCGFFWNLFLVAEISGLLLQYDIALVCGGLWTHNTDSCIGLKEELVLL